MKRKGFLSAVLLLFAARAFSCEVCQANQPEVLKDITHGTGPQGELDYVIIWSAVVIVGATLLLAIKYLFRPEPAAGHIKNIVVEE